MILVVSRSLTWGAGSVLSSADLVASLLKAGLRATLVLVERLRPDPSRNLSLLSCLPRHSIVQIRDRQEELGELARHMNARMLIASSTPLFGLVSTVALRQSLPYTLVIRGGSYGYGTHSEPQLREMISRATCVACVAKHLAQLLADSFHVAPIVVRHPPSPIRRMSKAPESPGLTPKLVYVGQFCERKGVLDLPELVAALCESLKLPPDVSLVGDGPLRETVVRQLRATSASVTDLGWQPYDVSLHEISTADFLLLPSWQEGRARVILEALTGGTIPIATDIPANREVLGCAADEVLWPVGRPISAARVVERLWHSKGAQQRFWSAVSVDSALHTEREFDRAVLKLVRT